MSDADTNQAALTRLTGLAREATNTPVAAKLHDLGRRRLLTAALEVQPAPPRRTLPWLPLSMGAGVACAAVALLFVFGRERSLTYQISGGQQLASNYVAASDSRPAAIRFSDGSRIAAAPGSRLRIVSTHVHGARVLIEHGTATADVTHSGQSRWVFAAGPFDIRVTGTRFSVKWDPSDQSIDLQMHQGSVEVDSPLGSSRSVVRAGERFRASLTTGVMQLEPLEPDAAQADNAPAQAADGGTTSSAQTQQQLRPAATRSRGFAARRTAASGTRPTDESAASADQRALATRDAWRGSQARAQAEHRASDSGFAPFPSRVARDGRNQTKPESQRSVSTRPGRARRAGIYARKRRGVWRHRAQSEVNQTDDADEADQAQAAQAANDADATSERASLPPEAWGAQVRRGAFNAVVAAALSRGLSATLATCSASQARALADAARYTGRFDIAERSLEIVRARARDADERAAAAFLLGRTCESTGRMRDADGFYRIYLREAPAGEFAADALAGHMRAVASVRGASAAKPIALEYLRRFRDGVHAKLARRLAQ